MNTSMTRLNKKTSLLERPQGLLAWRNMLTKYMFPAELEGTPSLLVSSTNALNQRIPNVIKNDRQQEGIHLLSIFPLSDSMNYARLSCIAVSEPVTCCNPPFCVSRERLLPLLLTCLPAERVHAILSELDKKMELQLTISDADARAIGFLTKLM